MKNRLIACFLLISLILTGLLSGCDGNGAGNETQQPTEPAIPIEIAQNIPVAFVDASYRISDLITEEKNVDYKYEASYVDPVTGETEELVVKRGKIIPKVEADIRVIVTASKGNDTSSVEFVIPINVAADALDKMLISDGPCGLAAEGVVKTLTKDTAYLKAENSLSAMEVKFSNPGSANEGVNLFTLSQGPLHAYYSAKVWRNAAVVFWAYNPMEQDVQFKLTSYNPVNMKALAWDSVDNTQVQTAKAGQWTQIVFSLYDMGIEQPLFDVLEYQREDSLKLLARYAGSDACTIYVDGIDIVHADSVEGVTTGYTEEEPPAGDFSDLLKTCKVYTQDPIAQLSASTNGNGSRDAYCFGSDQKAGYPSFYIDFPEVTDISGFDYLSFDMYAEKCYPWVSVAVRYLDENGDVQKRGTSYDTYREQWRTIYVNLDYLDGADLTKAVGISVSIHTDAHFVENAFNCVYFDNMSLYAYKDDEPQVPAATTEDGDIISGPMYVANTKPNTSGVCKVATDENGDSRSNSALLFWTNNACGYPNVYATFRFDEPQDWSKDKMMSFDSHQYHGHYWMGFTIFYLDEEGKEQTLFWRHDTVLTNWLTTSAPFEWFKTPDGETAKPEHLKRVVGLRISVDLAVNVTDEVAYIFFDNFDIT